MKRILFCVICLALEFVLPLQAVANDNVVPPKEWVTFVDNLQKEMRARGISQQTLDKAYKGKNYYHKAPDVVKQDKKQVEFVLTTCAYVNRLVNEQRVNTARKKHKEIKDKYQALADKYNVPLNYMVAFWAVETNFGQNKGKYNLIDSLTNLSYKNRRAKFFKEELYNVLKIMDKTNLSGEKMEGSWAGAMGHFQFMPSTYNHYAVDYDGDDIPDIWNSFADALASAENYLTKLGWKTNEPWGTRIQLPWDFDLSQVGRKNTKTVAEWNKLGILTFAGEKLPYEDNLKGSVILPDGRKGPAYIVFGNFKRVMIWNRSDNYAIAVVTLADYIGDENKKYVPLEAQQQYVVNNEEILEIQKFYNRYAGKKIAEDGKLGSQTRAAVKFLQHKAKLPEDGYPDYRLLQKIKNHISNKGFYTPIPEKKPKKK